MTLGLIGIGGAELIFLLILLIGVLLFPLLMVVNVLQSKFRDPYNKLVWVVVILLVPLIGALLYLLIGRNQRIK